MMQAGIFRLVAGALLLPAMLAGTVPAGAQDETMADVEIGTRPLRDGIYMLTGRGGNIGVCTGEDGVFLIDDQYAPLTDRIIAAIAALTDKPVRFLVNTHWHGDHTGGNENLGRRGVVVVAHDNVYERMSKEGFIAAMKRKVPPSPKAALPVISFSDAVTFHFNGHAIRAWHVQHAHTDGDVIIHFPAANVIHMGDVWFHGSYPFIDASSGGTLDGVIAAVDQVLAVADGETLIIPGHGELAGRAELAEYRAFLVAVRERVGAMLADGAGLDEIRAAKPLADFDARYGGGFLDADRFLEVVIQAMQK